MDLDSDEDWGDTTLVDNTVLASQFSESSAGPDYRPPSVDQGSDFVSPRRPGDPPEVLASESSQASGDRKLMSPKKLKRAEMMAPSIPRYPGGVVPSLEEFDDPEPWMRKAVPRKGHTWTPGREVAQELLDAEAEAGYTAPKPNSWCTVSTKAPSKAGGYIQLSTGGANKFATLQEVALWASGQQKPSFDPRVHKVDPNDVSHLCDEPACTIPSHVCVEPKGDNNSRKGCLGVVRCSVWCALCHGSKYILVCRHKPTCIRWRPGYSSFDDLRARGLCSDRSGDTEPWD